MIFNSEQQIISFDAPLVVSLAGISPVLALACLRQSDLAFALNSGSLFAGYGAVGAREQTSEESAEGSAARARSDHAVPRSASRAVCHGTFSLTGSQAVYKQLSTIVSCLSFLNDCLIVQVANKHPSFGWLISDLWKWNDTYAQNIDCNHP